MLNNFKKFIAVILISCITACIGGSPVLAFNEISEPTNELSLTNLMSKTSANDLVQAYETYSAEAYEQGKYVTIPLEIFMYNYNPSTSGDVDDYTNAMIKSLTSCPTI